MDLILFDREGKYTDDFLEFLIEKIIKSKIYGSLKVEKLSNAEYFINSFTKIPTPFKPYISAYEVIVCGIENIVYRRYNTKIVIGIDNIQLLPGTSAKLYSACKMINDGAPVGGLPGYPIFSDTFTEVKLNINMYYDFYCSLYAAEEEEE